MCRYPGVCGRDLTDVDVCRGPGALPKGAAVTSLFKDSGEGQVLSTGLRHCQARTSRGHRFVLWLCSGSSFLPLFTLDGSSGDLRD